MKNARSSLIAVASVAAACATAHPVEFAGVAHPPRIDPSAVQSFRVLPSGYRRLGKVRVRCKGPAREAQVHDAPWLSVVCDDSVLRQLIRQRAAEVGGTALVNERCAGTRPPAQGARAECGADVAAAPQGFGEWPSIDAGAVAQSEYAGGVLTARVDVTPVAGAPIRPRVDERRVRETPRASIDCLKIAGVAARCERCARADVEQALRSVVGSLGGVAVSDVSCREFLQGWQCLGDAMVEERDQAPLLVW